MNKNTNHKSKLGRRFWTDERLEQAACDELARHGGTKDDLARLKAEFRKANQPQSAPDEIPSE